MQASTKTMIKVIVTVVAAIFLVIQFLSYGRDHENSPVVHEPNWDSPQTRALAQRACFDCHSNETVWPWYSNIAPASWLVQRDVEEGRQKLNFSEWGNGRHGEEKEELLESVREGEMPLRKYVLLHPEARLTKTEQHQLLRGLSASIGEVSLSQERDGRFEREKETDQH